MKTNTDILLVNFTVFIVSLKFDELIIEDLLQFQSLLFCLTVLILFYFSSNLIFTNWILVTGGVIIIIQQPIMIIRTS